MQPLASTCQPSDRLTRRSLTYAEPMVQARDVPDITGRSRPSRAPRPGTPTVSRARDPWLLEEVRHIELVVGRRRGRGPDRRLVRPVVLRRPDRLTLGARSRLGRLVRLRRVVRRRPAVGLPRLLGRSGLLGGPGLLGESGLLGGPRLRLLLRRLLRARLLR